MGKVKEILMDLEDQIDQQYRNKKTTVINLFGGPGVGKSTLQADLYADMKKRGCRVEMVREVAKKWAWDDREITALDQLNIIGEQIKDESELYGKVDFIITDSPIMLGAFYMDYNHGELFMQKMVQEYMEFAEKNGVNFMNILLSRKHMKYNPFGRFESEWQAKNLDEQLQGFLFETRLEFNRLNGFPEDRVENIIDLLNGHETCGFCRVACKNNHCVTKK